jgi:predicted dithiol-disulfide oxidoreductase (DUF899 family)
MIQREITREEATRMVRENGWRELPLTTIDASYYFDGPETPDSADVFGDKRNKRPWRLIHHWAGYGPERFVVRG